jgi:choline dehydrogenase-like flavoprotein
MEVIRQAPVHDAIVVGSGAAGGMVAYVLCRAGARVLMLEAGAPFDTARDSKMFQWPYQAPLRGGATAQHPFGYFDASYTGWKIPGEPYEVAEGDQFMWWRSRMLGGRTNHWGRITLRMGPYDFKPRSRDGLGFDWPVSYDDIAPYYDKVEELIGVYGSKEGMENAPDGVFQPPPVPRCWERFLKKSCDRLEIPCIPARLSILTRPLNGRPACHYCGQCGRGCATGSNFSSPTVLLPPALATGNLEIRTDAMCRKVLTDSEGLATGVSYVDRKTGRETGARGRIVVLCASSCESARLLLNSRSSRFPSGLANSSGAVGRFLTDTVSVNVTGQIPALEGLRAHNDDGSGGPHLYVPWWNYGRRMDFPRGYHIEFWNGGRTLPSPGLFDGARIAGAQYGAGLKKSYRRVYGSLLGLSGQGEMIPNADSWCEVDKDAVDQWGIPTLRFHWKWSEHELGQARHMRQTFREIIETMGGRVVGDEAPPDSGILRGGETIHELGTTRMGADPKTSVLNAFGQAWDVKNLFVADGGAFVSNSDKNPTLTILALAWRAAEHLIEERRKGDL